MVEQGNNAAAMRLCDELIQAAYDADIYSPGDLAQRVRKIKAALAKPPRNCDRFVDINAALVAYAYHCEEGTAITPEMQELAHWLLDTAQEGGAK